MYVLNSMRLKDPELIDLWGELAIHARKATKELKVYTNTLDTSCVVSVRRGSGLQSGFVFFTKIEEEDIRKLDDTAAGERFEPLMTTYKVSRDHPFILREVDSAAFTVNDDDLELAPDGDHRVKLFARWRAVTSTGFFTPDADDLRALIRHIEQSESY